MLIGAHTSISSGVSNAIRRAKKLGFTAIQIFTKNNNRWTGKELSIDEINSFKLELINSKIKFVVAHDSYLINLCAANKELLLKSQKSFIDEINNCEKLGIEYLNFHPGSHVGQGEKKGIDKIIESLNIAHTETKDSNVQLMLETTAGQGTALGYTFEQLADIIAKVECPERMCVCIDTAHIFAAGYDFRNKLDFDKTFTKFDKLIGINKLKCFHINDSKKVLGSRVDRHEHIGKGEIGLSGFSNLMNERIFNNIPKILETPKEKEQLEDIENINLLKSLVNHN